MIAAGAWYFLDTNRTAPVATTSRAPVVSNAPAPTEAKHLSIVVLPFANLSNDPAQDYFADGLTENLASVHYRDTDIRHLGRNENAIA